MAPRLRNVALPALTLQFASISEIFGGSVLVEQVFSYPGLGQAAVTAGLGGDLPLLLGITVISAAIVFGGNLIGRPALRHCGTRAYGEGWPAHEAPPQPAGRTPACCSSSPPGWLFAAALVGLLLSNRAMVTDFSQKNLAPCLRHPFGTDWMGRDMLARTLAGLSLSIRIGALTAAVSAAAALVLGVAAAVLGRWADAVISWCIDLVMGIPHILLVLLISLAFGRGFAGWWPGWP